MKTFLVAFGIAAALATNSLAATCADRGQVVAQLETKFDEVLLANAVNSSNQILEVFGSHKNDTWSILVYLPKRDVSCLAATGHGLDQLSAELQLSF